MKKEPEIIEAKNEKIKARQNVWKWLGKGAVLAAVVLLLMSGLPEDPDGHDDSSSVFAAEEAESRTERPGDIKARETESVRVTEPARETEPVRVTESELDALSEHETEPDKKSKPESETASGQKKKVAEKTESLKEKGTESGVAETEAAALTAASKRALILENKDQYPEEILRLLEINSMEAIDFVLDYPQKKGQVYADDIKDDYEEGKIPLLIQWDERWGYGSYGNNVIAVSGCGPTCMAMVIAGLTGTTDVTPYTMAKYSDENGYVTQEGNTMWTFIREGGMDYGVAGTDIALDEETVKEALQAGKPVICSMRPGDFTTSGHFIVLTGYEDGMISVNDPASRIRSGQLWTFERLAPQIKNLWMCEYIGGEENVESFDRERSL